MELSESGQYCSAWTGNRVSGDEVATRACQCVENEFGDDICSAWDCKEKAAEVCDICDNLTMSIACFGVVGLLGVLNIMRFAMEGEFFSCCTLLSFLWTVAAGGAAILYGGRDGGMYVGIMWVGMAILYGFCCRPTKD